MKIVVTGGGGRIGRYVVGELVQAGYQVISIDIKQKHRPDCDTLRVDLTDEGQVFQALAGTDAVVHLGAWPNPGLVPDTKTYGDNVRSTFNVFQACADLGIRRVVYASTNQVYGFTELPPIYVPVDEEHPLRPMNCYALSKMAGEQAADYFSARYDMVICSFRITGTLAPSELAGRIERTAADPASGQHVLWTYNDTRDVATACRLALEVERIESAPYNIGGTEVALEEDSVALVQKYCGGQTEIRTGLEGRASPSTCARATAAFGYRPRFSWSVTHRYPEDRAV